MSAYSLLRTLFGYVGSLNVTDVVHNAIVQVVESLNDPNACTVSQLKFLQMVVDFVIDGEKSGDREEGVFGKEQFSRELRTIINSVCWPVIRQVTNDTHNQKRQELESACELMCKCLSELSAEDSVDIFSTCCSALQDYNNEDVETDLTPVCAVEVLKSVIDVTRNSDSERIVEALKAVQDSLKSVLVCCEEHLGAVILAILVPKLVATVSNKPGEVLSLFEMLWKCAMSLFCYNFDDCTSDSVGVAYLIVCNMVENLHLYRNSVDNLLLQMYSSKQLWFMIQRGFTHKNPLNRKRAMFVLKHVLQDMETTRPSIRGPMFWWQDEEGVTLSKMWSRYILIMESLEERQVHVIKPVLPGIEELISAVRSQSSACDGLHYLHSSWITTIYHRMFIHESRFLRRFGVIKSLNYNFDKDELLYQEQTLFILHPLLVALNDSSLFVRGTEEIQEPNDNIPQALALFINNCNETLEEVEYQVTFFSQLLQQLQTQQWSSVPLLYISRALACLPKTPVWQSGSLNELKQLLATALTTQEVFLRGAIQCFLLQALLRLADEYDVSFSTLADILSYLKRDESFRRGTKQWEQTAEWLNTTLKRSEQDTECALTKEGVTLFCESIAKGISNQEESGGDEALLLDSAASERDARLIVLLMDAGIMTLNSSDSPVCLSTSMQFIVDMLTKVNSRPYLTINKIERTLQLILAILEELQFSRSTDTTDFAQDAFYAWFLPCVEECLKFISWRMLQSTTKLEDLDRLDLYLELFRMISNVAVYKPTVVKFAQEFSVTCGNVLQNPTKCASDVLQRYSSVKCLVWMGSFSMQPLHEDSKQQCYGTTSITVEYIRRMLDSELLSEPLKKHGLVSGKDRNQKCRWGRLISDYLTCNWTCFSLYLSLRNPVTSCVSVAHQALTAMELTATEVLPAVGACLKVLLPQILDRDYDLFCLVLSAFWKVAFEKRKSEDFWAGIKSFVEMAFQSLLLENPQAQTVLNKYVQEAFSLGDSCPAIFRILVFHCFEVWSVNKAGLHQHLELLVAALVFGPVHRKDRRASNEAAAVVSSLGEGCAVNLLVPSGYLDDIMVRVDGLVLVLQLLCKPQSVDEELIGDLIDLLLKEDTNITSTRSRYFGNSMIHRVKNRIWQTILVLQPMASETMQVKLLTKVYTELVKEGSQPSVRLFQEWLAVRILSRHSDLRQTLWKEMNEASQTRVGSVGSFLAISCHLSKLLYGSEQFIMAAIPNVLPWCMAQNFNTRVTAQVAFHQMWKFAEQHDLHEVLNTYRPVEACLDFTVGNRNASKNTNKLLDDFYYGLFHCQDHYTLQTIFYELPRLTQLTDEEWISPMLFSQTIDNTLLKETMHIPIYNADNRLSTCEAATWAVKSTGIVEVPDDSPDGSSNSNVQKKIIPWKQFLAEQGILSENTDRKKTEGLVVVASLIDRTPNLGGLCRTCEIFGASEYVLGSLKFVEDQQFQNLSVSADKWLSITEVKVHQVRDYLLNMKKKGYTLVGVEQTAHSQQLHEYKFPQKTVLLLGNEKEGIPVQLIQLLDVCLEIPQFGVVRSLNVHVSGAVVIWEYARQHLVCASENIL